MHFARGVNNLSTLIFSKILYYVTFPDETALMLNLEMEMEMEMLLVQES